MSILKLLFVFLISSSLFLQANKLEQNQQKKKIIYLVPHMDIAFWKIMAKGIKNGTDLLGYDLEILSADYSAKKELENTIEAINKKVDGIIVSPSSSSACNTILKFIKKANIPVVISDIGANSSDYVSYISSNNMQGAYEIGKFLSNKMIDKGFQKGDVGIIAVSQKRLNGIQRTSGFLKAMDESNIKVTELKQLTTRTQEESYNITKEMIKNHPNLRAIWIQTSNIYKGVIKAINEEKKQKDILLVSFDAEPEFLDLIPKDIILASAMQEPYLMGKTALVNMDNHLNGMEVEKNIQLPILLISKENIKEKLPLIKLHVLGIEVDD